MALLPVLHYYSTIPFTITTVLQYYSTYRTDVLVSFQVSEHNTYDLTNEERFTLVHGSEDSANSKAESSWQPGSRVRVGKGDRDGPSKGITEGTDLFQRGPSFEQHISYNLTSGSLYQ